MSAPPLPELNPEKAYIFRITHRDNLPWILDNGLHCRKSDKCDPNFVNIGLTDLIEKRHVQYVDVPPGGTLSEYVPFYFTPLSMMAFNIHTGRNVRQRPGSEIVILVSSLRNLGQDGVRFLFATGHASAVGAEFHSNLEALHLIDWNILQRGDFSRDNEDLEKTSRYQAEALVHKWLSIDSLVCVACYDHEQKGRLEQLVHKRGLTTKVIKKRGWYF